MPHLVTGATGFLGGHLVDRLTQQGHEVRVVVRDRAKAERWKDLPVEACVGDVTDADSLAAAAQGCEVVYHLAAHVSDWGPWEKFESVTIRGTRNMLEAATRAGCRRFVLVSTALVYDDRYARLARVVREDAPLEDGDRAYGFYAKAKVRAEQVAWDYQAQGRLEVTAIRPTWIYGPRDFTILPRLLEHFSGPLACWIGRVDPSADPIFVTDVADAAITAGKHPAAVGEAFNIAPDREIRLREFLGALFHECDIRPPRLTVPYWLALAATRASESWGKVTRATKAPEMTMAGLACITVDQHVDPTKAIEKLGWRPQVALDEGARRTAEWLKQQQQASNSSQGSH
ncbi:MAG: NAD-dependent epimerase/dehydratase family protein [Pirellulales bacterium]